MSKRIEGGESNPEARPSIYPLYHLQSQSYYHFQTAGQTYIAYFFSFSSLSHIAQFYIHFQTAVGVLGSNMCRFVLLLLLIPLGVLASTNSKHLLLETAADHPAPLNYGSNHTEGSDYAQSPPHWYFVTIHLWIYSVKVISTDIYMLECPLDKVE